MIHKALAACRNPGTCESRRSFLYGPRQVRGEINYRCQENEAQPAERTESLFGFRGTLQTVVVPLRHECHYIRHLLALRASPIRPHQVKRSPDRKVAEFNHEHPDTSSRTIIVCCGG